MSGIGIVALDVHYDDARGRAWAAGVRFGAWGDGPTEVARELVLELPVPHAYVPGAFYLRELPCLIAVAEALPTGRIVIDGYVDLGPDRPGLGRRLFAALAGRAEVIGVAKTRFAGAAAVPVLRGRSKRPLWVTSTGDAAEAAAGVASMHGPDRLPTLLQRVDRLARDAARQGA